MALAFRDVVLPLCGLANAGAVANRQTTLFIAHHGITTVDDLNLLQPNQAKDLVKGSVRDTLTKGWVFSSKTT